MIRRQWKKVVFWILTLMMLLAVLPWALVQTGNLLYGNPGQARAVWTIARYTSIYGRDVVLYNIGNTHFLEQAYPQAAALYAEADSIASPDARCPIRYNWGLTLQAQGDTLATTDTETARQTYAEALRVISLRVCQDDPAYRDNFAALYDELLKKLEDLNNKKEPSKQSGDSKTAEQIVQDASKEARQAQDYKNREQYYSGGSGSSTSFKFVW